MTAKMLLIAILGLVGVIGPYFVARRVLDVFYPVAVVGAGPPLLSDIAAFGVATLIAAIAMYLSARFLSAQRGAPAPDEHIEDIEELPE